MSKLEVVRALYDYNEWANDHVLNAAAKLSEDKFRRKQGASFGSVEANLAHIMGGQVVWLQRWTSGANAKPIAEVQSLRGLEALRGAFADSHAALREFVGSLTEERLHNVLAYRDSAGTAHERVMWQLMVHLANHGTHHRSECAMAMSLMGKPMRELDYHFFELERGG
jgi:uncharacterized damage-inducible protein DinB